MQYPRGKDSLWKFNIWFWRLWSMNGYLLHYPRSLIQRCLINMFCPQIRIHDLVPFAVGPPFFRPLYPVQLPCGHLFRLDIFWKSHLQGADNVRVACGKETTVPIRKTCGCNAAIAILIHVSHLRSFMKPVSQRILNYAERVYP